MTKALAQIYFGFQRTWRSTELIEGGNHAFKPFIYLTLIFTGQFYIMLLTTEHTHIQKGEKSF